MRCSREMIFRYKEINVCLRSREGKEIANTHKGPFGSDKNVLKLNSL